MDHAKYLGRCVVVGVGALVLSGAGIAGATTPPSEPPDDTVVGTPDTGMGATSEPMAGGGPSDCPAITAAEGGAPATSDASMGTDHSEMTETTGVGEESTATDAPTASEAPAATTGDTMGTADSMPAASGPFVQIAESDEYGPILVDSACRTLYVFAQDVDGQPTCVDDCAANWPPLIVTDGSVPALADELDPTLFGTADHPDGVMLTVDGWPLYYFAGDAAPGDTNGQGVGGVWWLVTPDGTLLEEATDAEGSAPAATEGSAPAASMPTDTVSVTTGG